MTFSAPLLRVKFKLSGLRRGTHAAASPSRLLCTSVPLALAALYWFFEARAWGIPRLIAVVIIAMNTDLISLLPDTGSTYDDLRPEYLAQLTAPTDDMWTAFADMASAHALMSGGELAGVCALDDEAQLLRFHVRPRFLRRSDALLRCALGELGVKRMVVGTLDPNYLSAALDHSAGMEVHSLLFGHVAEPEVPGLDSLRVAAAADHRRVVDFQAEQIGAPLEFLEVYVRTRIGGQEMLLLEEAGQLLCVGELRRDQQQPGIAHLGLIVHADQRGRGLGSRLLSSLVAQCRREGLAPHCSTEVTNGAARRAIERAGFHAQQRLLMITPKGPE